MKRVMATGVFDILHPGHIHYLSESKKLGDELVVVVARDITARKNGKDPVFDENTRLFMVSQLRVVDRALLGHENDIFKTVKEIKPDIITIGYDQKFDPLFISNRSKEIGINLEVVRISGYVSPINSSSLVRKKLLDAIQNYI
ncbi:MAG: adenylyltransferase/cytidyltransferase family protein [Thermoplasmata archaeon]